MTNQMSFLLVLVVLFFFMLAIIMIGRCSRAKAWTPFLLGTRIVVGKYLQCHEASPPCRPLSSALRRTAHWFRGFMRCAVQRRSTPVTNAFVITPCFSREFFIFASVLLTHCLFKSFKYQSRLSKDLRESCCFAFLQHLLYLANETFIKVG